jgi:hypothetical protein
MSVKDLLRNSASRVDGVRLSDLGEAHRKAPYVLDSRQVSLASRVGDFVANLRDAMSSPTHDAISRSSKSLEDFIDAHGSPDLKEAARIELTKRWLMDHQTATDLVGMLATPEAGIDASIVNFTMSLVPQFNEKQRDHVVCELSGRVLEPMTATLDPDPALAFVHASRALPKSMRTLNFVARDTVELSNYAATFWTGPIGESLETKNQVLARAAKETLVDLARSPRSTVLMAVAHSQLPEVQSAVQDSARVLGQIDPKLQQSIESICASAKVLTQVPQEPVQRVAEEMLGR